MGFKNSNILQAWLVLLLCLCFGSALAAVHVVLSPTIEANKINETREKVPGLVFGDEQAAEMAQKGETVEVTPHQFQVEKPGRKLFYTVYEALENGKRAGWVVKSSGPGYADKIELLVGLDANADKISGLFVLEQKETPGLGNKVGDLKWRNQFIGKPASDPLAVTKTGASKPDEIDAVTGATISSRSVVQIVNTALADLRPLLEEKK
jgi:electron transport complex protein RnfG